ncbi:HvfC/BufC N-terminal domain-containing protein [Calditrichota bacterium LG25]
MSLSAETRQLMEKMYGYILSGSEVSIPGTDAQRMTHYRRLVRNIFSDTLRRAFPITVEILTSAEWDALLEAYMREARPQTPYIWKMPYEFYAFVVEKDYAGEFKRPYLDDLLFFEWIEIDVFTMPDQPLPEFRSEGDFLKEKIALNPDHKIIELEYPVHKMAADETPPFRGQYFVLVFRELDSGQVKFVEISPLLALVWQHLQGKRQTGQEAIESVVELLGETTYEQLTPVILPFFNDMLLQGAVLGFSA